MTKHMYFLRNCFGDIVGRKQGYATKKGALCATRHPSIKRQLSEAWDLKKVIRPLAHVNWRIQSEEVQENEQ